MFTESEKLICALAASIQEREADAIALRAALAKAEADRDAYLAHLTASQEHVAQLQVSLRESSAGTA